MAGNYRVSISTKSGKVTTIVGDNQHITIDRTTRRDEAPPAPATSAAPVGQDNQDIVQPIGQNAKVIVNGKRIK